MAEIEDLMRAVDSLTDEDRVRFLQMMVDRYKTKRREKWERLTFDACVAFNNLLEEFPKVHMRDKSGYTFSIGPMKPDDFVAPEEDLNDLI